MEIEPLEERRLLQAHIAAPVGFKAVYDIGSLSEQIDIDFSWNDSTGETGYEIQRSITGFDDAEHANLWEGFGPAIVQDQIGMPFNDGYRRYYFRLRSVGHTESPFVSEWTDPPIFAVHPNSFLTIVVPEDNTVKVSAIARPNGDPDDPLDVTPSIELKWPDELAYADADYTISRKSKDELSFAEVASLTYTGPNPILGWMDKTLGSNAYEYQVVRTRKINAYFPTINQNPPAPTPAIGYVYAGVDVPLSDPDSTIQSPGTVILIVDNTQAAGLTNELDRLEQDLIAEGWTVDRFADEASHIDIDEALAEDDPGRIATQIINRDNAIAIRQKIIDAYEPQGADVTTVLLIGHIPIPMSGHNSPDGHGKRPMPADLFYGEMDGLVDTGPNPDPSAAWTDSTDLLTGGGSAFRKNPKQDGQFDQLNAPTDPDGKPVELMVGRVDMRGLPNFQQYSPGLTEVQLETELLRRYLDKDHAFRTGQVAIERGGQIRDQIGYPDSSTGAWQTMSGFFGPADPAVATPEEPDNIDVADWPEPIWPLAVGLRSIDSADLDNDGDVDFLTASYDDNRIAWYENVGGDLTAQHIISDEVLGASAVIAADLNGDGCDDIVAASAETGEILWYDNDIDIPTGTCQKTFAQQPLIEDPLRGMSSVFAIDLDGDEEKIPRKCLTRAAGSDRVQVMRRGVSLATAI